MNTQTTLATPEAEIRDLVDSWHQAVLAGDLEKVMSHYAPDVLSFDAIGQLQFKGANAYRKHWEACMSMCPGTMTFEIHELESTASEDLAFSPLSLPMRWPGRKRRGEILMDARHGLLPQAEWQMAGGA